MYDHGNHIPQLHLFQEKALPQALSEHIADNKFPQTVFLDIFLLAVLPVRYILDHKKQNQVPALPELPADHLPVRGVVAFIIGIQQQIGEVVLLYHLLAPAHHLFKIGPFLQK